MVWTKAQQQRRVERLLQDRQRLAEQVSDLAVAAGLQRRREAQMVDALSRAEGLLSRPHKHDWRPDLVTCKTEQDALSILRAALEQAN